MTDAQFIVVVVALFAWLTFRLAKALGLLPRRRPRAGLAPVQGRRTGLSEHASPFGQTERRAERTLDRAPP
ncbi:hypothetical protein D6Z43_27700 [Pseudomonas sp. DY-1]|uniref:hypothetical protein n=1 Tax=Pseudomonas sp. DY-1 TaxID=1755504 RepID=UPI000EA9AEB6|nr:hypothetical protein [Pseudomonas sp. DY-1]AYF85647.1 hypothetical protein D6Z43_00085 [Pseudomonas sp. DY-1]AYF85665.1 hypothetical protein D6Z43_00180 [Pseudomonas sp. DY-1]AYF85684.1 hypothetical protein D6Z43_00285 [Pseudomonas sp. DY-1]AYF85701.1 hypothetical protein D6Z43_00380 [Pseudomonas sp. DY-1]AYF90731.1 hypothetical protein D6Z43_27700 [Pseudomonas sp. DY-1]